MGVRRCNESLFGLLAYSIYRYTKASSDRLFTLFRCSGKMPGVARLPSNSGNKCDGKKINK